MIAGLGAALHPILFDDLARCIAHQVARRLGISSEEVAHHQCVGTQGQGDGHVGRAADSTICGDGDVGAGLVRMSIARRGDIKQR